MIMIEIFTVVTFISLSILVSGMFWDGFKDE